MPYNPWIDVRDGGRSLQRVKDALDLGFAGVKIYPQNGFRPYGNAGRQDSPDAPTGEEIDKVLEQLWLTCANAGVPVMAHAGPSLGRDREHDLLGGPKEWQRLLDAQFWTGDQAPRVNLGHFGGDTDNPPGGKDWPHAFAGLMNEPRGRFLYGDLGYWDSLECDVVGAHNCELAKERLREVLNLPAYGGQTVADRVMYGSDWLMLSKEKDWGSYSRELYAAVRSIAAQNVPAIFGGNARKCFAGRV